MKKSTLDREVELCKNNIKNALQIVYDALNQGQQKKILEDDKVKAIFERYNVKI